MLLTAVSLWGPCAVETGIDARSEQQQLREVPSLERQVPDDSLLDHVSQTG